METKLKTKNGKRIDTRTGTVGGLLIIYYPALRDTGDEGVQKRSVVTEEGRDDNRNHINKDAVAET